ncbi:MAG: V-type ATPase 116kDa subunit family protein [Synechococcus sp.]
MTFRPVPARWFEVIATQEDLLSALDILRKTGDIELEIHSEMPRPTTITNLQNRLEGFNQLARQYRAYWPKPNPHATKVVGLPGECLDSALEKFSLWRQAADSLVELIEELASEQDDLLCLSEFLQKLQGEELDFANLARAGPILCARLFVFPFTTQIEHLPTSALSIQVPTDERIFLLIVGEVETVDGWQRDLLLQKGRAITLPNWLNGKRTNVVAQVEQRKIQIREKLTLLNAQLDTIATKHHLPGVLSEIRQIEWFITHASNLPVSDNFAWITGWTSDISSDRLNEALEAASVRAVVHYPPPPVEAKPPMVLQNPWWSKPFELFAKLLGIPSTNEIDPSMFLALIVPLLFGYMFGDVGQGFILMVAGITMQRHFPMLKLLIGCGLSAMVFGLVFGSVFASETIINPLWVNPINSPLSVLFVPLGGGVILLLLGLAFSGVQAYWQGELKNWLLKEAATIAIYIGIVGSVFHLIISILILIGGIWYVAGSLWLTDNPSPKALLPVLGQLLESGLQLIINTISFIRVGAFALAHAGLSLAFIIMADATGNVLLAGIIILIGNIVIILLEGLVVSIQTTRLILFEFFIRFMRGTGRMFHPLAISSESS